jgi:hypothetical protein
MADHPVTLTVPEHVYENARHIAEATAQPVEQVLARRLEEAFSDSTPGLPPDETAELAAFKYLSDDTLRSIAREQMARSVQERMVYLGDRQSRGTITPEELQEYTRLVEQGDRLMLRKAWAAGILMDRGHKIGVDDMAAPDE